MYTTINFATKKELREAVAKGVEVRLFAPGLGTPVSTGVESVCGPHYPKPHKWYANVEVKNGVVTKVLN